MAHLAKDVAGVIFFGLITLSATFAVLAFFMIARRLVFPRFLEVNDDAILFPHGFPRTRNTRISYADIIWLRDGAVASNPSFCLMTCKGVFEIGAARFSNVESYRTVKDFIHDRASLAGPSKDELAKILAAFPIRSWHRQTGLATGRTSSPQNHFYHGLLKRSGSSSAV